MVTPVALTRLIYANWRARDHYDACKARELSPKDNGLAATARRALTDTAKAEWAEAEAALWRRRSPLRALEWGSN